MKRLIAHRFTSNSKLPPIAIGAKLQTTMIDTIIFDLGGVLIDWDPRHVYKKIFSSEEEMEYFFSHICTHEWNITQDAGRPLQEGTELLVKQHPEYEAEIRAFYGRWEEMLGGPVEESVSILKRLKEINSRPLYALTNWSAETFPVALKRYDFLHWFDGIVVSGEEKTRKPFPEIYQILISRYDITPENALFIDDNLDNVEAAKSHGIHGIHFTTADALRKDLQKFDISLD